ncbi:hypothetical protein N9J63_04315 [Gammaproteobacteria bacterium]|nr:hypothetical protein [Gammaproteobacteria bacterium]
MDLLKKIIYLVVIIALLFYMQHLVSQTSSKLTTRISIDNAIKFPKDI